jgi:heme-degrading monooxygenase HmoA
MNCVLRAWTFWIPAHYQAECQDDMERMVFSRMRQAVGNQHTKALFRDAGDGTVEVIVLSVWDSMAHIKAFMGPHFLLLDF